MGGMVVDCEKGDVSVDVTERGSEKWNRINGL